MENIIKETKTKMEKSLVSFKTELTTLRTGRANLSILDGVRVNYYGTPTLLNQVAALNTPDARLITIQPWEKNLIGEIEKAILKSDVGLTPSNDGTLIRLPIPALNEERRKELVKLGKKYAEEARVAIRMVRRDSNDHVKKLHDGKKISDDDFKKGQTQIQKITDDFVGQVDQLVEKKEKDILSF